MKDSQKGFGVIETLLSLVLVAIVVFVGYYIYHSQKTTNNTYNSVGKTSQSVPTKSSTGLASIFKFPELGVQFKLPNSLKGLSYSVEQFPDGSALNLSLASLAAAMNKCVATMPGGNKVSTVGFASISKSSGQHDPNALDEARLLKQFPTFYIMIAYPNGAICGSGDQALDNQWNMALGNAQKEFSHAFQATATEIH